MNLPNSLSVLRIMLIPVFALVFFSGSPYAVYLSAAVLLVSLLTDILDGYIARKYDMITDLGKLLDPLADKLTQIFVALCLYLKGVLPLFAVIFFALKETLVFFGGTRLYAESSVVVSASWYGKAGTGMFYAAMAILLLFPKINSALKYALVSVVILWAVIVGIMYLLKYFKLKKANCIEDSD